MTMTTLPDARTETLSGAGAALLGLAAGGCRVAFAGPTAYALLPQEMARAAGWFTEAGGSLIPVQSDTDAALMASGAAQAGSRAAALIACDGQALAGLTGLDGPGPVLAEVTGRLTLSSAIPRAVLAPHTPQAACEAGQGAFDLAAALRGPVLLTGLGMEPGRAGVLRPDPADPWAPGPPPPIHHDGPDDPDLLIVGAGPGFAACAEAREDLEAQGHSAAHLHLLQVTPFPGAIIAPALTSARRVLIVEPGGAGTLTGLIQQHLGAPETPFVQAEGLASAASIADRAQEVIACI